LTHRYPDFDAASDHSGAWQHARRLFAAERHEVEVLRSRLTVPDLADALGVQIHRPPGLTCPSLDHDQTGQPAPAWAWWGADGVERWHCSVCDIGGDLFAYVIAAGQAESFAEAVEVVAEVIEAAPLPVRRLPTSAHHTSKWPGIAPRPPTTRRSL
jgi:hypothetical protein